MRQVNTMTIQSLLARLNSNHEVSMQENEGFVRIENQANGNYLVLYEEPAWYEGPEKAEYEYIVRFSTQHRHFHDLKSAIDYIMRIVEDKTLAVEFFDLSGNDCFGGDIDREKADPLTAAVLAKFGFAGANIKKCLVEIHSWSGRYDVSRMPVSMLPG